MTEETRRAERSAAARRMERDRLLSEAGERIDYRLMRDGETVHRWSTTRTRAERYGAKYAADGDVLVGPSWDGGETVVGVYRTRTVIDEYGTAVDAERVLVAHNARDNATDLLVDLYESLRELVDADIVDIAALGEVAPETAETLSQALHAAEAHIGLYVNPHIVK